MDLKHLKQEPGSVQSVKSEPALLMKEEILKDSNEDGNEQQCVQVASTPAGTDSMNEACFTGDLLNVKQELDDMDIGPIVLQHTDIYYAINKNMSAAKEVNTIVDDGNEPMPSCRVKKESAEDKLRGTKINSCKYCTNKTTEEDYNRPQYRLGQQNGLQQHFLGQDRAMSLNGFKCDACSKVIYKPYLLSSSKTSVTTSTAAYLSEQKQPETNRNETTKTKQKPMEYISEKGYSSKSKFQSYTGKKSYHCDSNFALSDNLTKHQCKICVGRNFPYRSRLIQHMRTVHTGEKPYQCDMCDAKFANRSGLILHIRVHTGEKPYQCDMCDAKFANGSCLIQHIRLHTGEKPYQCDMCDAKFSNRSRLTYHIRGHTGEKPYQCDICEAKFARSYVLSQHMTVHTREKPYQCNMCDAKFSRRNHLTNHMRGHTGEKPYQCDICKAKFARRYVLGRHMTVHTGEKPYQCDKCDAKFAYRSHLTVHGRVNCVGGKPYQCDMCEAKFANRSHLTVHMRVHRGEKP